MPKYIRFGGQLHSFPDGTTDGQIAVALRQESGLTPHGDKPTKSQDDPNSEPMPGGVVSDTLYGMGRSLSPTVSREDRNASVGGRGELAGKAIGAVGDAQRVALDTLGVGKPTERTEQTINLFAQPGKTPTENLAYAGSKIADTAKRAFREMQQPGGEWTSAAMLGPPVLTAKFTGSLLDSVDDGRDPAKESLVQQRQRYADAAKRVVEAKSKGMPVDPADRDLFAAAKAGVLPKAEIDPATGQIAEPLPGRPGGMAESVVRGIAKSPASLAETYMAPENAAIMAGTQGAMAATKLIPHPLARAAAQLALGAGTTGYFAGDMAKGVGESAGRAVAGDFDQRAVEEELPGQIANAAFTAHLASTGAKPLAESIEGVRAQNLTARSRSDRADALATGNEKLAANIAAGRGRFDGMNHKEIAAVSSDRKAKAIAAEKAGQPLPADPLTRDASVDELTQIARSLYGDRPDMKVTVHENADTVPADLRGNEKTFAGVPALFDPKTNTVHFIRDRIGDAYDAATLGLHEKTHGTVDIPAHQVAGFAEPMVKAELAKLVEEGRLSPEEGQRLSGLTGKDFVRAVKAAATGPDSPVKIAADEVMAQYGQMPTAEPGKFAQGMATLASKIPGVQLTQTDAMALAAKQRAARARPFQQNRPIELMGKIRESLAAGNKAEAAQTLDEIGRGLDAAVAADTAARQAMADARVAIDNGDSDGAMSALSRLLAADTPGVVEPPRPKVEEPVPAEPVRPPATDVDAMLAEQQANDAARATAEAEASRARSEAIRAEAAKADAARAQEREVQEQIRRDVENRLAAEAKAKAERAVIEGAIGPEQAVGRDVAGEILDKNLIGSEQRQLKPQEATPELMDRLLASKGDRVSFFDTKSKKVLTGTIYSADKKKVAVEVDGGGKRLVARDDLRPAEPTVAPEPPVAPPAQQATPAVEPPPVPSMLDRRTHSEIQTEGKGRRWSDLTDQERLERGYQSDLTGLPNRNHWTDHIDSEGGRQHRPKAFYYDMDDFKALNQKFLEANVDRHVLPAVGDAIKEVLADPQFKDAVDIAHVHGDEFYGRAKSPEQADAVAKAITEKLGGLEFEIDVNGKTVYHKGLGGSHGVGDTIEAATAAAKRHKAERKAAGLRVGARDIPVDGPPAWSEAGPGDVARAGDLAPAGAGELGAPSPEVRFSRPDKSKHDQLVHPILGDLVDLASAVMADPAKKIDSPEKLARAMTDEMGAGSTLIKEFEREAKTIFEQAKKAPEERDKAIASAREALDKKLKPAKELGVSEDERTRMIQEAVDRAREDAGIPGTKKDAETLASAYKLVDNLKPEGVEDLVVNRAKSTGGTLTDAETVAAKMVMQDADLNAAMMNDPKLFARRLAFFNAYRITGTEQARSFRQRRWDNVPAHERVKQALYEIFLTSGDKKPKNAQFDADKRLKDLKKFLSKELGVPDVESIPIEVLTDQKRMTDLVRDYSSRQANLGMKARTWFLNSLVSAFKTHAANLSGNVVNMGVEYMPLIGHRAIEARLNQLFRIDGIMPSDLKGMGAQMVRAQQMALADATNYLKTGKNNLEEAVYGADWVEQLRKQKRSFSGKAGAVIEGPTRLLGTEDAYFVSLMGHMEALAAARMFARREGLRVGSAEYNARVDSMMSDKKSRAWEKGMDRAEYLTFKDETGRWIRSMLAFRRAHPNMTYVIPFLTTPANLIARGTEFVPGVGLIGRGIYRDFKEWKSGANTEVASRYSRLAAAQLIGLGATLGIAATGASMFKDDNDEPFITGSEPPRKFDQGEKEARRRSLPAYTIVNPFDPGERLSYRRVDPIATSIGLSVDLIDIYREALKDKNFQRAMDKGKNAILGQLVDKPFLKGPSDWIDWFQDAPGAKFPAFEAAAGFYPRALQQIPAALDPYVREQKQYGADAEGEGQKQGGRMAKTWLYRATGLPSIPGIGQLVEPKVNLYGDTVRKTGSPLYRMTVPFDRYGEEGISPEGRAIDLKYLRAVDTLPEDVEQIPTESGPRAKLGANLVQMYPKDWAEFEGERGSNLKEWAKRAGLTLDPNKPLTQEQITILRELASAGSEVAKAKIAPRYLGR